MRISRSRGAASGDLSLVDQEDRYDCGSVRKPKDGDPRACYVVLDTTGEVDVEFRPRAVRHSDGRLGHPSQ
jgi:hypothetical protein